jgi:NADPH:quinone reductase-like Zn-dependent oxidoreductase
MRAVAAVKMSDEDPVGGVELIDIADPVPGPGQVMVNVRACSLNHHDIWTLRGVGVTEDSFPMVLGSDVSGVTDDGREVVVHALVADPQRGGGDELLDPRRAMLAEALQGGLASKVVVPERNVIDKPTELSFEEAACLPTAWLTAYRMLFVRAAARPGQSVLVQGAGGGVATAAIVLAHAAGLRVLVTGRTPEKLEAAIALGADSGFSSGERLPDRVDIVLDTVGAATWKHSVNSVRTGGVIVVAGATTGALAKTDLSRIFLHHISIHGSAMGRVSELVDLLALCRDRGVRPHIDSVHTLDGAVAAFTRLASGHAFGKVVVTP